MNSYQFYCSGLGGLIINIASSIKASHSPQEELWAAGDEALWMAGVAPSSVYSPLSYTIIYRGIVGFLRQNDKSYIETIDFLEDNPYYYDGYNDA